MMLGDKTKADARHLEWEAKGKIWHVNGCQYVDKAKLPMLSDDLGWVALVIMLRHNIQNTFHFTAVLLREKVIGRPTDRRTKILLKISFKYRLLPPPSQKREGGKNNPTSQTCSDFPKEREQKNNPGDSPRGISSMGNSCTESISVPLSIPHPTFSNADDLEGNGVSVMRIFRVS